jgi:GT2 family glycosyltransferase
LDCWKYTKQFIENIKKIGNYRIIIIDNGSQIETKNGLAKMRNDKLIDVIYFENNRGVAYAWNIGVQRAIQKYKSKYILICNNDILLRQDTIKNLIKAIKIKNVALVTPTNTKKYDENPERLNEFKLPIKYKLEDSPDFSCFMITKKTYDKIGKFDENFWPAYFEDNDYHYRIKLKKLRGVKTNKSLYYHFGSMTTKEGGDIKQISNINYIKNREYFIRKWGGEPGKETYTKLYNIWA